jgi:hypothetical protein
MFATLRRLRTVGARSVGASLLAAACAPAIGAGASGAASGSGIVGRVVAAPTCPVERVPPAPGCGARPLVAKLRVRLRGGVFATVVRSGSDGRFRVRLTPGTYIVQPLPESGSPFPRPPGQRLVRVRAGRFAYITVTYDTGIR